MADTTTTKNETGGASAAVADPPKPALTQHEREQLALKAIDAGQTDRASFDLRVQEAEARKAEKRGDKTGDAQKPGDNASSPASGSPDKTNNQGDREARLQAAMAEQALRRDGYTDEMIAELSPATRIKIGLKVKEKLDARQREYEKSRKHQTQAGRSVSTAEGDDPDPAGAGVRHESDPEDPALGLTEGLDDALDLLPDEDRERVSKALANAAQRTREAETRAQIATINEARRELLSEYPGLAEDSAMQAVVSILEDIDPDGSALAAGGKAFKKTLEKAAEIHFGPSKKARQDRSERTRQTLDGQPDSIETTLRNSGKVTQAEVERIGFELLDLYPGDPDRQRLELDKRLGRI